MPYSYPSPPSDAELAERLTIEQRTAVINSEANAAANGASRYDINLIGIGDDGEAEITFRYDTAETHNGMEVTIFAADGSVIDSQDYGGALVRQVEFCGCTNDALERGKTCGRPKCPNLDVHNEANGEING